MVQDPFGIGPTTHCHRLLDRARPHGPRSPGRGSTPSALPVPDASGTSRAQAEHPTETVARTGSLVCAQCGASFVPRRCRRDTRFCRAACRVAWHSAQKAAKLAALDETLTRAVAMVRELRD